MKLSIVSPIFNEADSLPHLFTAVSGAMQDFSGEWEWILVNDGSSDNSFEVMSPLAQSSPFAVKLIDLRRNFGQTAAIAAGIDHAQGEVIVLMDADLQNDPADIPMLLEKINEGYDVVSGWRYSRKDAFLTRVLPSKLANGLISWVTGVKLHDYGCTLKAYRREVLKGFRLYGEMHRFIPVYAHSVGARVTEVKVRHHARVHGKTKYGLERTLKVVLDLFTVKFLVSYASKPIYLFGGTGLLLALASLLVLLFLMVRRVAGGVSPFDSPLFPTALMVGILGFQSILMGLLSEQLTRTYHESQNKPTYTIREQIQYPKPDEEIDPGRMEKLP
jgi:glycosyltransferase involved in cell wall biosynthesis